MTPFDPKEKVLSTKVDVSNLKIGSNSINLC